MGIHIGTLFIPYYGLLIVIGLAVGVLAGYIQTRLYGLEFDDFILLACFTGLGAVVGAKLLYLAVSWKDIDFTRLTDPEYINLLMNGGFVFYGGLIGGLAGIFLGGRIVKVQVMRYAQICIPCIPIVHAFGRFGCAAAGCCYGIPYDGIGAVVYTESLIAPEHVSLFPVQALEAVLNLMLAAALFLYVHKKKGKELKSLEIYLGVYAVIRFILEFFRYDDSERGILLGVSTSQWISVGLIAAVLIVLIQEHRAKTGHCTGHL